MTRKKAAIIGTGGIARSHARAYKSLDDRVELVAGMDIVRSRAEQFTQDQGISRAYTDLAEMLATERPDMVSICTPPGLHARLSIQCLEAGAWVLCEKPLCASLEELERIREAEFRTGNFCASVFQQRFGSAAQHVKRLVDKGALGRPLVGICNTLWYRDAAYYAVAWRGRWDTELGGVSMGHGIHAMDLFLWLMGDWAEVRAATATLDREIEVEDVSMAMVRFQNGALGSVANSVLCPREETYLRLDFEKATVEARYLYGYGNQNWTFTLLGGDKADPELQAAVAWPPEIPSSHRAQIAAFLDCLERGERPLTSGDEAQRTIGFISGLYKAAVTGKPVLAQDIRPGDPFHKHVGGTMALETVPC